MLQSCPRCTQLLPADAAFCRRCGAEIGLTKPVPLVPVKKAASLLTPLLVALLAVGLIFASLVFVHVPQQVQTIQPAVSSSSTYYTNVPARPVYPEPLNSEIPLYAPVVVTPVYPNRADLQTHHHEMKR